VRSAVDLVELPYTFTQQPLLTADGYIKAARDRGAGGLTEGGLEVLHRLGYLTPFLRVRRDGRLIARLARRNDPAASQVAHWEPTNRRDLLEAHEHGRLHDPATEPFVSRRRLERRAAGMEYRSSTLLYSPYQLLAVDVIKRAGPYIRFRGSRPYVDGHGLVTSWWHADVVWLAELVTPLSALEPAYYPSVIGTLKLPAREDFARYDRWRQKLPLTATRRWLDVDAGWFRETAASLLHRADSIDPLDAWLPLVREADPAQWLRLKGDARIAIDMRIAAELFLRYYEALARGRRAAPLPEGGGRWRGAFDGRLKPAREVDRVLTEYGLSPHPSLILVVEGATEHRIFPRLMKRYGIRGDERFIRIEDAESVDRNLEPLVAYAIAPRTEPAAQGQYLRSMRPLTRILVVSDAEGSMRTTSQRRNRLDVWIERVMRTLPPQHRTAAARQAVSRLVYVDTWRRNGESFEFAHFTDRELATAISRLDRRTAGRPSVPDLTSRVAGIRASRGNLKWVMPPRTSKTALADQLWPVLEAKLERAERRGTERRIPIVRVLARAIEIAQELPRAGVVIPLGTGEP
jgi:hypothetical protein